MLELLVSLPGAPHREFYAHAWWTRCCCFVWLGRAVAGSISPCGDSMCAHKAQTCWQMLTSALEDCAVCNQQWPVCWLELPCMEDLPTCMPTVDIQHVCLQPALRKMITIISGWGLIVQYAWHTASNSTPTPAAVVHPLPSLPSSAAPPGWLPPQTNTLLTTMYVCIVVCVCALGTCHACMSFARLSLSRSRMSTGRPAAVNNYSSTTIVAAPPVFSPFGFGYGGYGFGGFMPVMPIPFFGGFLQVRWASCGVPL